MTKEKLNEDDLRRGARVIESYLRNNHIPVADLPHQVQTGCSKLAYLTIDVPLVEARRPAVRLDEAVRPDRISCLECGREVKLLRRHLRDHHALTPEAYKSRWGLPANYPMVSAQYSATRVAIAKANVWGS